MVIGVSPASQGFTTPQKQSFKSALLPAPNRGIDTRAAIGAMSPENCIYAYNLVPEEYGMKVRSGFGEHQISLESVSGLGVKTIIPINGITSDKLFAVTNEGIWDVTVAGGTPTLDYTFTTDTTADAGHGVSLHYITTAGNELVFYADSKNGLHTYDVGTDTWIQTINITGLNEVDIAFITVHKQRIWLIEENATSAWYLGVGAVSGAATQFFFGGKFPHGGTLKALINWSVDGGAGVDDLLVAVSSTGDVIVYKGADPSTLETATATGWAVVGTYFIGKIPEGRRFFSEHSGELYLLSSFGLISMSDLLRGVDIRKGSLKSLTYPIASLLRSDLADTGTSLGWEPVFLPSIGSLVISSPQAASDIYLQYVMSLSVEGWGFWRGVPTEAIIEYNNTVYFGTSDNRIMSMNVNKDYVLLDTNDDDYLGQSVDFSLLTAYNDAGSPGMFKIGQYIRPDFLNVANLTYQTRMFYDYSTTEIIFPTGNATVEAGSVWDTAEWDVDIWGSGGSFSSEHDLQGTCNMGRTVAIALRGSAGDEARLVSFDVGWTEGGFA